MPRTGIDTVVLPESRTVTRTTLPPPRLRTVVLLLLLAPLVAACRSPLNPEYGLSKPLDPGSVWIRVTEDGWTPVSSVHVAVELRSEHGNSYFVAHFTGTNGTALFTGIPAGRCKVQILVPNGYVSAGAVRQVEVDVVKDQVVVSEILLQRN